MIVVSIYRGFAVDDERNVPICSIRINIMRAFLLLLVCIIRRVFSFDDRVRFRLYLVISQLRNFSTRIRLLRNVASRSGRKFSVFIRVREDPSNVRFVGRFNLFFARVRFP